MCFNAFAEMVLHHLSVFLPQGHLSDAWSRVTKNAIAETIIALTKMEEEHRSPVRCIATTRVRLHCTHFICHNWTFAN